MFGTNINPKSLFSTMFQGHSVKVISIESHEYHRSTEGKLVVSINLTKFDPQNIDNEVTVSRAITSLISDINDWPETSAKTFKATDLSLEDSMFVHLGGSEWIATVSYRGDATNEADEDFEYGSYAWQRDRGIPFRSASY